MFNKSLSFVLLAGTMILGSACIIVDNTGGTDNTGGSGGNPSTSSSGGDGGQGGYAGQTGVGGQGGEGGAGMCVGCAEAITPGSDATIPFCSKASEDMYYAYTDCFCMACATECKDVCAGTGTEDQTCLDCRTAASQAGGACATAFNDCSGDIP